jgi:hypothetical protein
MHADGNSPTTPVALRNVEGGSANGDAALGARVSVVIPALNDEKKLPHVFRRLPAGFAACTGEIVVAMDADGSARSTRS